MITIRNEGRFNYVQAPSTVTGKLDKVMVDYSQSYTKCDLRWKTVHLRTSALEDPRYAN